MSKKKQVDELLHNPLREKVANERWYSQMFDLYKAKQKSWEFNGFLFEDQDTVSYVTFSNKLKNEAIIWFSYQLRKDGKFSQDCKLYALGVIPI